MAAYALPAFLPAATLSENQIESPWECPATSSVSLTKPKEQAFLVSFKGSAYRIVLATNSIPPWVSPTISAFIAVQSLPDNWDSYSGKRINRDLIRRSLSTLGSIMENTSPAPAVVPLGDGGLQLEWHRNRQDLEIVFPTDDSPHFYYRDKKAGTEQEGSTSDISDLVRLLRSIA
jgi:hypothetical protein